MNFKLYLVLTSLVNVILFYSIFDLYFVSPIVQVSKDHSPLVEPPASRLVLFVADGLRADKFFSLTDHLQTRSPFLRYALLFFGELLSFLAKQDALLLVTFYRIIDFRLCLESFKESTPRYSDYWFAHLSHIFRLQS